MYEIMIGEISKARKRNWHLNDENPYDVIEGKSTKLCTVGSGKRNRLLLNAGQRIRFRSGSLEMASG